MYIFRYLQQFGLWKDRMPMTYFLKESGLLKIYKLSDFQSPELLDHVIPRNTKTKKQCRKSFDADPSLILERYNQAHSDNLYAQEKLNLLPIMTLNYLRKGEIDNAIQCAEENLKLNGGLSSLEKDRNNLTTEKISHHAVLPAANWLSLKFMQLKETPEFTWSTEMQQIINNYRLCLEISNKYEKTRDVQDSIRDNFLLVKQAESNYDHHLLHNGPVIRVAKSHT